MAGLHFDITGDNSNFMNKLKQTEDGIKETSKQIESSGLSIESMFGRIAKSAAGIGAAFSAQQFASQVMKVRGEFQQLEVAFNTMLNSAEKAESLMSQITRTAAVTPFGLQDVANGAKQLLAYGVASEEVNDTLIRLGDIAAGLSIPLNDLVYLYGTTMTQGRMFTQDLRQFQGRGIPLADELAKQFGVTKDKVGELVTAGKVGFEEMKKGIISMTSEGGKFGGLMEAQSKTITGQISNIEDAIDGMFNEIGKSSEGVINSALSIVSDLVSNYEKVGEVIGSVVVGYGSYKAAIMVGIAWQKAEAAITAEAAVQKSLAAIAGHKLTESQARGAAISQLYAAAQARVVASLKALTSATILNPYVLIAGAIAAATYGLYKFVTRETAAEKATKQLNDSIDKQQRALEEHKNKIDELVSSLDNLELSEGTRIANFQTLKQEYPEILKNINNENEFLKEKHKILQLINKEQTKEAQKNDKELLEEAERRLSVYQSRYDAGFEISNIDLDGGYNPAKTIDALNEQKKIVDSLKARVATPEVEDFLAGIKDMKADDISSVLEEVNIVIKAMESSSDNAIGLVSSISNDVKEFSKAQLISIKSSLEGEQASRSGTKNTASKWLAKYKKDYDNAEKALTDFKISKEKMSEIEYERHLKELTEARDAAKKKYEEVGGLPKSDKKAQKTQEEKKKELLEIERNNQQDRINLMKEGAEKERAQIELNYKKELDAYKEAKKKYGDTKEVSEMKKNADLKYQKEKSDLDKQILKDDLQAMYDYLQEYGTIQEQKYAIAKQYDDMIAEERNENRKILLEKEKQTKLDTLNANDIAMGIDWGVTFKGVGNVLGGIAKETLSKVEEYMKTDEFKNLSVENKKTYSEFRDKLRQETGEGSTSPFNFKQWDEISKQVDDYKNSVNTLKNAQIAHNIAIDKLKEAEEELKNATTDTAEVLAKEKIKIAQIEVDKTAINQIDAENNVETSKNNLIQSTNAASQGIENFASYLNEMNSGSLYGFANGITKLITSLTKGSDGVGKSLEQLGGKVGGIVGAILQIIEVLGDAPAQFIDELLRNVAVAVESILVELPQIIGSVIKGVGDIVGGIITGIGSWFGFGRGDKKRENRIKDYQKRIEELDKSYEELEKQVGVSYSNVAKGKIEEQNKNLQQQANLIQMQIREEESKKKTDNDRIKEWREQLEEINNQIDENKEVAKDAIFGSDLQSAIENFASAYTEAWSAGEDKAKSAKEVVRDMIKGMITESIKAASSDPMKAIRDKLLQFWSDEYISGWEQDYINQMASDLQKDLDSRFGWADSIMDDESYSQEATSKAFETISQDTADELLGRFTAFQISNEEIKNQMIQGVVIMSQIMTITTQSNGVLNDILIQHAISNNYLADLVKYSKVMSLYGEKIDKLIDNTKNL